MNGYLLLSWPWRLPQYLRLRTSNRVKSGLAGRRRVMLMLTGSIKMLQTSFAGVVDIHVNPYCTTAYVHATIVNSTKEPWLCSDYEWTTVSGCLAFLLYENKQCIRTTGELIFAVYQNKKPVVRGSTAEHGYHPNAMLQQLSIKNSTI